MKELQKIEQVKLKRLENAGDQVKTAFGDAMMNTLQNLVSGFGSTGGAAVNFQSKLKAIGLGIAAFVSGMGALVAGLAMTISGALALAAKGIGGLFAIMQASTAALSHLPIIGSTFSKIHDAVTKAHDAVTGFGNTTWDLAGKAEKAASALGKAGTALGKQAQKAWDAKAATDGLKGSLAAVHGTTVAHTNALKNHAGAQGASAAAAKAHSAALKAQAEAHKKATEAAKAHADALKKLQAEQKATADAAAKAAQAQVDAAKAARQSIIDSFNISSAGQTAAGGGTDILTQMKQKLADAQAFAHGIAALKIAGLNSDSLLQLEAGGPAGSLDAINQLLNGGANTISQVNSLESQLGQTGTGYGQIQGGFTMASGAVAPGAIVVNFNNNGSVDSATMTQAIQDSITGAFQQLGTQIQSQQTFTGQGGRRV